MRHGNHKFKIASNPDHRRLLMRNLSVSLIEHEKIKTTHTKCRALKPYFEKLITLAKVDSVANRRLAFKKLNSDKAVKKLFAEIGPKYKTRPGGYTRILKLADGRVGDNAPQSFIALV